MKKIVFLLISLVCCQITAAQRVCYSDGSITIEGDPMTWTLATDLSLFHEDGRATCAFVFPRQVNGEPAHYADAYANDQDWALLYYMLVNEKNIKCIN